MVKLSKIQNYVTPSPNIDITNDDVFRMVQTSVPNLTA